MRHLITTAILSTSLLVTIPAFARSNFESTISAPVSGAVKLEIIVSEDLTHRAENLPKRVNNDGTVPYRSQPRGHHYRNSAFGNHGYYGTRDVERLQARLEKKMVQQLTKRGVTLSDTAATVLRVTLVDAKPSRPTFRQLSKDTGLSHQSYGLGGAAMVAQLVSAGGQDIGEMHYRWYENDIHNAAYSGTWTDANRSLDRFAKKAAKEIAGNHAN